MGKAALTVLSALALLSCLLLAGAGGAIGSTGGDVRVEETVLAGDPAAAAGLEVSAAYMCAYQMHWLTRLPAGRPEEQETAFSYTTAQTGYYVYPFEAGLQIDLFEDENATLYFSLDEEGHVEAHSYNNLRTSPLFQEVAERALAQKGGDALQYENYVEDIPLEDKYDFLPLTFRTWNIPFLMDEHLSVFEDYFRIPFPPGLTLRCSVGYTGAYTVQAGLTEGTLELECDTVILDEENREDLLFAIGQEYCTIPLDSSLIPGGWGIYRLTCVKDENQALQPPRLTTVYSVPEGERIFRFWASQDKRDLFLLTHGADQMLRLTVLDRETLAPRQTLDLFSYPQGQPAAFSEDSDSNVRFLSLRSVFQGEDYLVIPTGYTRRFRTSCRLLEDGTLLWSTEMKSAEMPPVGMEDLCARLALVVREDGGSWQVRFVADTSQLERQGLELGDPDDLQRAGNDSHMAFDGTRLAVAGTGSGTPYVAVWSGPELDFLATYRHSLSDSGWSNRLYCQPAQDAPPWQVAWRDIYGLPEASRLRLSS